MPHYVYVDAAAIRNLSLNVNVEHLTEDAQRLLDGLNAMATAAGHNKQIELTDIGSYKSHLLWAGREDVEYMLESDSYFIENKRELDSMTAEELDAFIDTVTESIDWCGDAFIKAEDGNREIVDAIESQLKISRNSRRLFILDDELAVEDKAQECIDGYLWATNGLMSKLEEQVGAQTMSEMSRDDCPNFYVSYNVREQTVQVDSTYWIPADSFTGRQEKHAAKNIPLTEDEKSQLVSALEDYCKHAYAIDCLGFVNEARGYNHLPELQGPSLNAQIQSAAVRQAAQAQTAQQPEREAARA